MIVLQAAWLGYFALVSWGWLRAMQWVAAATHHTRRRARPGRLRHLGDLPLAGLLNRLGTDELGFTVAPLMMLLEDRSALSAPGQSLRLGKAMTAKLVEINMVMGIANLALIVLAMVLSAAPLPFGDQLGPEALHSVWIAAAIFYLVASDYFQVVRLKGYLEFWRLFCISDTQ